MIRTAERTGASRYAIDACAESQDSGCCKKVRSTSKKTIRHQKYRSQNRMIYCIYFYSRISQNRFFTPKSLCRSFPFFNLPKTSPQPAMSALSPSSRLLHLRRLCGQLRTLASEPSSLLGEDARSQATNGAPKKAANSWLVYNLITHITITIYNTI